jgi:hypothetical protein
MEAKSRQNDRDPDGVRACDEETKGKPGKTAGQATPIEEDETAALEQLLRPSPPVKSRSRGGTGIGRDLDH